MVKVVKVKSEAQWYICKRLTTLCWKCINSNGNFLIRNTWGMDN